MRVCVCVCVCVRTYRCIHTSVRRNSESGRRKNGRRGHLHPYPHPPTHQPTYKQELAAEQAQREAKERQKKAHGDAKFLARIARKNLRTVLSLSLSFSLFLSLSLSLSRTKQECARCERSLYSSLCGIGAGCRGNRGTATCTSIRPVGSTGWQEVIRHGRVCKRAALCGAFLRISVCVEACVCVCVCVYAFAYTTAPTSTDMHAMLLCRGSVARSCVRQSTLALTHTVASSRAVSLLTHTHAHTRHACANMQGSRGCARVRGRPRCQRRHSWRSAGGGRQRGGVRGISLWGYGAARSTGVDDGVCVHVSVFVYLSVCLSVCLWRSICMHCHDPFMYAGKSR